MTRYSKVISIVFLLSFLPSLSFAQTRQTFNPNATLTTGGTYGGVTFSGVGGAIAQCANVGGFLDKQLSSATSSIGGLFKSKGGSTSSSGGTAIDAAKKAGLDVGGAGTTVPVNAQKANDQLSQANRRDGCLNGVAYAIQKSILQQVTGSMLNWVNTGFNGSPLYVRDVGSYLRTIADEKTARVIERLPQDDQVFGYAIRSILSERISGVKDGMVDKAMNTKAGKQYQEFQKDFTSGGWEAFLNPNNNPIGAIFDTADELSQQITTEQENIKAELQRNNGFLDLKKCVEWDTATTATATLPSSSTAAGQAALNARLTQIAATQQPKCLKTETVTPGSVIAAQINTVTTSPIRQLEQADQINEVLGSYFDQLLNKFISQGLASLRGRGGRGITFNGIGSNVVLGTNGQPINSSNAQGILGYQVSGSGISSNDFDVSRPQQIRAVLQAQYDYLNHALDARVAMDRIVPTLGALDYCIPGPNPTWQDHLQDNANAYFGNLQEVTKESSLGRRLLQSIPIIGSFFSGDRESHTIAAVGTQLFDRATNGPVTISDTVFHEDNRSTNVIFINTQLRFNEVMDVYKNNFTKDAVKNAFTTVDPANSTYINGFIDSSFTETSKLPQYDQAIGELDANYATSIQDTRDAVVELEAIRTEVNSIVATAKARYIAEQNAAGTPVNLSCINEAYKIDTSPIVAAPRQESDTPSPFLNQSLQGANYFYNHL